MRLPCCHRGGHTAERRALARGISPDAVYFSSGLAKELIEGRGLQSNIYFVFETGRHCPYQDSSSPSVTLLLFIHSWYWPPLEWPS